MSWLDEGLKFLQEHFAPLITTVGSRQFSNKTFIEIKQVPAPLPGQFVVNTLGALRDLINCNTENIKNSAVPLLHIVGHEEVRLEVGISDPDGRRLVFATAKPVEYEGFEFDDFQSLEDFIIGIQAHFSPTPDREYLLSVASRVTDEMLSVAEDDGVSQQVSVKASIALKSTDKLRSRVTLAPYRTFPEVDQPQSEFIFRARKGPQLALFEADGGKWKVAAMQNIAYHLRELKIELPIIA